MEDLSFEALCVCSLLHFCLLFEIGFQFVFGDVRVSFAGLSRLVKNTKGILYSVFVRIPVFIMYNLLFDRILLNFSVTAVIAHCRLFISHCRELLFF